MGSPGKPVYLMNVMYISRINVTIIATRILLKVINMPSCQGLLFSYNRLTFEGDPETATRRQM